MSAAAFRHTCLGEACPGMTKNALLSWGETRHQARRASGGFVLRQQHALVSAAGLEDSDSETEEERPGEPESASLARALFFDAKWIFGPKLKPEPIWRHVAGGDSGFEVSTQSRCLLKDHDWMCATLGRKKKGGGLRANR